MTLHLGEIKVGMFVPTFLPAFGGTEYATYYLAKELTKLCNLGVYTNNFVPTSDIDGGFGLRLSSGLVVEEVMNGVRVYRYPFTCLPVTKTFSLELMKDVIWSDLDIVHFQGIHRFFSRFLLQKFVRKKVKVITTHALQESLEILDNSKLGSFIREYFIKSLRDMDHIIALSSVDLRSLTGLGISRDKITVISNGIDPDKFRNRRDFVEKNGKFKILCVARFAENKNYELLVETLSRLRNHVDVDAYFVGGVADNEYFMRIRRMIKEKGLEESVRVCLGLDDPALIDCYLSCDLFVLPSRNETLPLTIIEAMYAGLPMVSTSVGGVPDIVRDGVNGLLVSRDDPERFYESCLSLLTNEKLREKMSVVNKETAKGYFWSKIARSTYNLYRRLVDEHVA